MTKPDAQSHAAKLVAEYGKDKALNIAQRKMEDAPFLVNGDLPFWVDVTNAIVGNEIDTDSLGCELGCVEFHIAGCPNARVE